MADNAFVLTVALAKNARSFGVSLRQVGVENESIGPQQLTTMFDPPQVGQDRRSIE